MGILSISRKLISKFKPKSLSSSSFLSRVIPPAAAVTINPQQQQQQAHDPSTAVGDNLKRGSMFLIEHDYDTITKHSLLSSSDNTSSWKDHCFSSPFSGCHGAKYRLVGSCKNWIVFRPYDEDRDEDSNQFGVDYDGNSFHQYQCRLSLWNPTTNRLKTLPPSLLPRPHPVYSINIESFGFGFDPKSHDYKLICFLEYVYIEMADYGEFYIELYSLKTDSWKQISTPSDVYEIPDPYHSVHINGVYYWARDSILSFDFADESFSDISLPPGPPHLKRMGYDYCLAEFHGLLAIIIPYMVPVEELTEDEKKKQMQQPFSIKIWVWNGKTWSVGPRVAVGDFPVGDRITMLMGLYQNDHLFLLGCKDETELMLFNCKTGKLENLGSHHPDPPDSSSLIRRRPLVYPYTVSI